MKTLFKLAALSTLATISLGSTAYTLYPKPTTVHTNPEGARSVSIHNDLILMGSDSDSQTSMDDQQGTLYLYSKNNDTPFRRYSFAEVQTPSNAVKPFDQFGFNRFGFNVDLNDDRIAASWQTPEYWDAAFNHTPSKSAVVVINKENNQWPICNNYNCVVNSSDLSNVQYHSSIDILSFPESVARSVIPKIKMDGDTIVATDLYTVVVFEFDGQNWHTSILPKPENTPNNYAQDIDIKNNRIVVGVPGENQNEGAIYIYEKKSDRWVLKYKYSDVSSTTLSQLGSSLSLTDDTLLTTQRDASLTFVDFQSNNQIQVCKDPTYLSSSPNLIAVDANRAVAGINSGVNSVGKIYTKEQGQWQHAGGAVNGFFPDESLGSFWSLDLENDYISWGWRNYTGPTNVTDGAVLGTQFNELACNIGRIQPINAIASSAENGNFSASKAIDGNYGTRWSSQFNDLEYLIVDLGSIRSFEKIDLHWEAAFSKEYSIEVSYDLNDWQIIYDQTNGFGGFESITTSDFVNNLNGFGRYVKINGKKRGTPWGHSLFEVNVYASNHNQCGQNPVYCSQEQLETVNQDTLIQNWEDHYISSGYSFAYSKLNVEGQQQVTIEVEADSLAALTIVDWNSSPSVWYWSHPNNDWTTWNNPTTTLTLPAGEYTVYVLSDGPNQIGEFSINAYSDDPGSLYFSE